MYAKVIASQRWDVFVRHGVYFTKLVYEAEICYKFDHNLQDMNDSYSVFCCIGSCVGTRRNRHWLLLFQID